MMRLHGAKPKLSDRTRITRIITVRMPKELHDKLIEKRKEVNLAINTIAIKALKEYVK